nr:hypothetical protein [Tanacetum cinerariifolium]
MSFSKRQGSDAVSYTKPLDSLKGWNDHFFWIDAFTCPALFPWHTGKSVSRDVILKSFEFSTEHYATLVAYPAPFHKNGFAFLYPDCLSYEGKDWAMQNVAARGGVMPTLPFVTSFVSTTLEREGGDHTELLAGANLRTIGAPQ